MIPAFLFFDDAAKKVFYLYYLFNAEII